MAENILAQSEQYRFNIQPTAYHQCCNMIVRSNVTTRQTYDAVTKLYTPDYSTSKLIIFPECQLIDPNSPTSSISANKLLLSFKWLEKTASGEVEIATQSGSSKTGYSVETTGDNKGQITVSSNAVIGVRRSLRFIGTWVDPVSAYTYRFVKDIPLVLEDITDARASIMLDMPNTDRWNPFRQSASRTIKATVLVGIHNFTENANVKIFWYRLNNDKTKTLITSADDEDNWEITSVTKGSNGQITSITVDRDKMGDSISYEVKCSYRTDGNLPSSPEAGDPVVATTLVRYIPPMNATYVGQNAIADYKSSVLLQAIVSDNQGVLDNWEEFAVAKWYLCAASKSSDGTVSISRKLLGTGKEITVPADEVKYIQLDVYDRLATVALTDNENASYLTDDDSAVLVDKQIIV